MEDLTNSLKNIEIDVPGVQFERTFVTRTPASCVNFQKCYIPPRMFFSLDLLPGDTVTLLYRNKHFYLKVFHNYSNTNNIEVYSVVECPALHGIEPAQECNSYTLQKLEELKKFTSIDVDLVCDSNYLFTWLTKKAKLIPLLERRILKNLLISVGSTVHLDAFPNTLVCGLKRLIIVQANTQGVGFINSKTIVNVRAVFTEQQYQQNNNSSLMHFFGAKRLLKEFTDIIDDNVQFKKLTRKLLPPIKQILLAGPSGCGKSSLVQHLSTLKQFPLVKIIGQDIHSKDPGQSEQLLRNMVQEALYYVKTKDVCMILIEDIDVLCPRDSNVTPHARRLSSQLMQLLEQCETTPGIVVVATTNKPSEIHSGLRRHGRLAKEIFMSKPSENERKEIISNFLRIFTNLTTTEIETISEVIASVTPGFLGADLKLMCQTACLKINNITMPENKTKRCIQVMKEVLLGMKPASLRNDVEIVAGGSAPLELGGLTQVKRQLELSVLCSLLQPHIYTRMGIQKPRGILLYGPPGCAKTSLAKALATNGNITVLYATNASIYSPYVGDAEKAIINLFHNARQNTPAVIFIDEIDSLVGSRSSNNSNDVQERVLAALLTQMDGIGITKEVADNNEVWADGDGVMVIAATNRPNEIDPALIRPGRFDRHIFVPPPDLESRFDILCIVSKNTPLEEDVDMREIASRTEFYSGADLKNLHNETVLFAMKRDGIDITKVNKSHYEQVLTVMKPSLSKETIEHFRNIF